MGVSFQGMVVSGTNTWKLHQLRLVVYPIIYRVSYIPGDAGFMVQKSQATTCDVKKPVVNTGELHYYPLVDSFPFNMVPWLEDFEFIFCGVGGYYFGMPASHQGSHIKATENYTGPNQVEKVRYGWYRAVKTAPNPFMPSQPTIFPSISSIQQELPEKRVYEWLFSMKSGF